MWSAQPPPGMASMGLIHRNPSLYMLVSAMLCFGFPCPAIGQNPMTPMGDAGNWSSEFSGVGVTSSLGDCGGMARLKLSTDGTELLVGGDVSHIGSQPVSGAALWNGDTWSAASFEALPFYHYTDVEMFEGRVFASGIGASNLNPPILVWTGSVWGIPGPGFGPGDRIYDLQVHEGTLLAAGAVNVGTGLRPSIKAWNGMEWEEFGEIGPDGSGVQALHSYEGELYAAGELGRESRDSRDGALFHWNDDNWEAIPGYARSSYVQSIQGFDGGIAVGGLLKPSDENGRYDQVAVWSKQGWSSLLPSDGDLFLSRGELVLHEGTLWLRGQRILPHGEQVPALMAWSGTSWVDQTPPIETCGFGVFNSAISFGGDLILSGEFESADGSLVGGLARRGEDERWSPLTDAGFGLDSNVACSLVREEAVWFGGSFRQSAQGQDLSAIARWDGQTWSTPGDGPGGDVVALEPFGDLVVAGGVFGPNPDQPSSILSVWDGTSWSPFGADLEGEVTCLQSYQGDFYVAGRFEGNDERSEDTILRWDGMAWHSIGQGDHGNIVEDITDMAVYNGNLIVAGKTQYLGVGRVSGLASWNGETWRGIGQQFWSDSEEFGRVLEVWNGQLVTSSTTQKGRFTGVALWDGSSWSEFDLGLIGIRAMSTYKGYLAIGGRTRWSVGNVSLLTLWDGAELYELGEGVLGSWIHTTASWGGDLYVGGEIRVAGGNASRNIARYRGGEFVGLPSPPLVLHPNPSHGTMSVFYTLEQPGRITLSVFDAQGRMRSTISEGSRERGGHWVAWDGNGTNGEPLPTGVYFVVLRTDRGEETRKLTLIR